MDGWVVAPTATALRAGWHSEYAEAMRLLGKPSVPPGRYADPVVDAVTGVRTSRWVSA